MDDEDNQYEIERQKTIAENRVLLENLGLDPNGASQIPGRKPPAAATKVKAATAASKKRKIVVKDEGPRRRSNRLSGLEISAEEVAKREEQDEKEREVLRVLERRLRDPVMELGSMMDEDSPSDKGSLDRYLKGVSDLSRPRTFPSTSQPANECYAEKDHLPAELQRLKSAFKGMSLMANVKVTSERIYSMVVHPEPTKTLVLAGDKHGGLGIWDALGPGEEKVKNEDDTAPAAEEDESEGRVWRIQAHARNSISCMKVDPINGSGVFSTSYDCSLRYLDFATLESREMFAFDDDDLLINHFDLVPNGQEAWLADKNGGISHVDFRNRTRGERRRWVVQEEGRAAKLGGISVNPLMPHLLVTAGNDQHLRIWDTRHLSSINPIAADMLTPAPSIKSEGEGNGDVFNTRPTSSISSDRIEEYRSKAKGKGLLRASFQHGKSCSSAYWDPWGRRILSTSYDDKLRIWTLNPQTLLLDSPLSPAHFQPFKIYPHNCQTGRWLTILRANWSLNMDYMPHFTVGNMKRSLDVIAATGDKIVSLWADGVTAVPTVTASHPSRVDCVVGGNTSGKVQLWLRDS